MRENMGLYRGKRVDNGEWAEGGYFKHCNRTPAPIGDSIKDSDIVHLIIQSGFSDWNMPRPINAIPVDAGTVGQFAGLLDRNGKRVFEGDIVQRRAPIYKIGKNEPEGEYQAIGEVFVCEDESDAPYWYVKSKDHLGNDTNVILFVKDSGWHQGWYVVGNIHDNPELLEISP